MCPGALFTKILILNFFIRIRIAFSPKNNSLQRIILMFKKDAIHKDSRLILCKEFFFAYFSDNVSFLIQIYVQ